LHLLGDSVICPHPPLKKFIFDGCIKGTTPLLLACHYGNLESVQHIIERWGVKVKNAKKTAATYYLNPGSCQSSKKIESATPLFVAAFQGHSKVVQYLLEKGADVTVKTSNKANPAEYDGLTPLDGAVSGRCWTPLLRAERNAILLSLSEFGADLSASHKPIWLNGFISVETTMALINHGLDLKQQDPSSGKTIFHHWVSLPNENEEDSLAVVKLLIQKGADGMAIRDNNGFTPIITAATGSGPRLYWAILDFMLEVEDIATTEKIDAMELAGAKIILFHLEINAPLFSKACYYLRRATNLRQKDESGSYQKKLEKKSVGTVEWTTSDQLEDILQRSEESEIKIHSLLVYLRILSHRSWEAVNEFFQSSFVNYGFRNMISREEYLELLDIYWAMLDTILLFHPSEKGLWARLVDVVCSLIYTLSKMKSFNPTLLNLEIIKKSIHLILATDRLRLANREQLNIVEQYSNVRLIFLKKLLNWPERMSLTIEQQYSDSMYTFLTMFPDLPEMFDDIYRMLVGTSLLQLCSHTMNYNDHLGSDLIRFCRFHGNARNYSAPIRFLLQLGANVNTTDEDGNGPLQFVAQADSEQAEAAGCLLLGYGAKLFSTNKAGKTAVDLWIERNEMNDDQEGEEGAAESRPDWCRTVRKLKCLSASCIRAHGVPYQDENKEKREFFKGSHSFIEKH